MEMVSRARAIEYVVTASETEALLLEDNFIKEARPPFNLRLRDDKSYPYIEITLSRRVAARALLRGRHVPGNLYFGPYSSARKVRETLELIGRIFPYRKCRGDKPGRPSGSPCLQYSIERSLAPCDERVSHEEYIEVIGQVIDFLRGRLTDVTRWIERDMARPPRPASSRRRRCCATGSRRAPRPGAPGRSRARGGTFDVLGLLQGEPGGNVQVFRVREGALVDRQTFFIENTAGREAHEVLEEFVLEYYGDGVGIPGQMIVPLDEGTAEIVAALSARRGARVEVRRALRGPKRRLLEMAQHNAEQAAPKRRRAWRAARGARRGARAAAHALGLAELPLRIECYDISNLGEQHAVGSMVVFEDGRPRRRTTASSPIRTVAGQDDFAMMHEVVGRRLGAACATHADAGEGHSTRASPSGPG